MYSKTYLRPPQVVEIHEAVQHVLYGKWRYLELGLPVAGEGDALIWGEAQRIALMNSVARGLPLGMIVLWNTELELPTLSTLGGMPLAPASGGVKTYILGGMRRMAALATTFGLAAHPDLEQNADTPAPLYIHLQPLPGGQHASVINAPTAATRLRTAKMQEELGLRTAPSEDLIFPLGMVSAEPFKFQFSRASAQPQRAAMELDRIERTFLRYPLTVQMLDTNELDDAADTLARLNDDPALGERLRAQLSR